MATFIYKARKPTGEEVTGTLVADSHRGALDLLSRMRLFPVEVRRKEVEAETGVAAAGRGRRIKPAELAVAYRQLADLLKAGVPLLRALRVLQRQTANRRLADVFGEVAEEVARGSDLTSALGRFPRVFSPLVISMVRAGEQGGFLEEVLDRIASFTTKQVELRARVLSAMAYPALLLTVGTAAVILLITFLIPRFRGMFEQLGGHLPLPTRILLGLNAFILKVWWVMLLAVVLGVVALVRYARTERGRLAMDRLKLRLPLLRNVFGRLATARFARTLGTLLSSGIPILDALRIARDAAGNLVFAAEIDRAAAGVKEGEGLGKELGYKGPFEPIVVDMISVGEETGNLDRVLVDIAESYDRQVDRAVSTLVSLLEPALLLVMAGIVGFIVASILLPVFTMSTQIG